MKVKLGIFIVFGILVTASIWLIMGKTTSSDFRIAYINSKGVQIESISVQRRMINKLIIPETVEMWIPGGLGWYESGKLAKLLKQEKQEKRIGDILWKNLGYDANIVVFDEKKSFRDWINMLKLWGGSNFLKYILMESNLLTKQEVVKGQLTMIGDFLAEIMSRDFADSQVMEEAAIVSVYNTGNSKGLASLVARNLEWSGLTINSVRNEAPEMSFDRCLVIYGENSRVLEAQKMIAKYFGECNLIKKSILNSQEVEFYVNDKYAEMINYNSY
ncbi:MAG: hypothetical protein WAV41_03490 [Microgenomates group bacterium]